VLTKSIAGSGLSQAEGGISVNAVGYARSDLRQATTLTLTERNGGGRTRAVLLHRGRAEQDAHPSGIRNSLPPSGRREFKRRADHIRRKGLARGLFVPLAIVLILLALLVAAVPFVLLRLNRIVAHSLRVIPLLLIMLTLLFVGHGLCAAHL
jgi:hypothetical protein